MVVAVIAMGGGGFSTNTGLSALDRYVLTTALVSLGGRRCIGPSKPERSRRELPATTELQPAFATGCWPKSLPNVAVGAAVHSASSMAARRRSNSRHDSSMPDEATPDEATPDEATPDEATPDEKQTERVLRMRR